jgi:transposase InsO family protein
MEQVWFLAALRLGVATVATLPAIWLRISTARSEIGIAILRFFHHRHAGAATVLQRTAGFGARDIIRSMGTETFDVFSRYVTGSLIAYRETAGLAKRHIEHFRWKRTIPKGQFALPPDVSSTTSPPLASLFADRAGVTNHGSPHLGGDCPCSQARFNTLKYGLEYRDGFGSIDDARRSCQEVSPWYNWLHRHSGLTLLTSAEFAATPQANLPKTPIRSQCRHAPRAA